MKRSADRVQLLNRLSHDLDGVYHRAARQLGVSDSELCVLYTIYEQGDRCLLSEICNKSGIGKQTINSALRKLERDGVLYLERHTAKTKCVCLTESGRDYMLNTAARLYEAEREALDDWTDEEQRQYVRLMKKYIAALRRQVQTMEGKPE